MKEFPEEENTKSEQIVPLLTILSTIEVYVYAVLCVYNSPQISIPGNR